MAYTFDGPNKLIILSTGTTTVDAKDLYSRYKDWLLVGDNAKYLQAIAVLGGDPLPGGRYLGTTYFLENGWKIRPYEGNHTLVLSGNLYSRDGSDPFVNTIGSFNVRIMLTVSNLVDTVNTGGGVGTASEVRDAVWSATNYASHGAGTAGLQLNAAGASGDPWSTDLAAYVTAGTAGKVLKDAATQANQASILAAISDVAVASSAIHAPAIDFQLVSGLVTSGTYLDTRTTDVGQHNISDNALAFDINYTFDIGLNSIPSEISIYGAVNDQHEVLSVGAWNYNTNSWEKIGEIAGQQSSTVYNVSKFILYPDHVGKVAGIIGDVKIRFYSTALSDIHFHIDQLYVSYATIAAVTGYTGHPVAATSTTIQLAADASSVDNYYVPALLIVNHGTGALQYAKVIGYVGSTKTLQLELPMATILDTSSHITLQPWASANMPTSQFNTVTTALSNIQTAVDQISGLSPAQETMILEMYEILGLDPLKPLIVTKTARTAGTINQSIVTNSTQTVVTRV